MIAVPQDQEVFSMGVGKSGQDLFLKYYTLSKIYIVNTIEISHYPHLEFNNFPHHGSMLPMFHA